MVIITIPENYLFYKICKSFVISKCVHDLWGDQDYNYIINQIVFN